MAPEYHNINTVIKKIKNKSEIVQLIDSEIGVQTFELLAVTSFFFERHVSYVTLPYDVVNDICHMDF